MKIKCGIKMKTEIVNKAITLPHTQIRFFSLIHSLGRIFLVPWQIYSFCFGCKFPFFTAKLFFSLSRQVCVWTFLLNLIRIKYLLLLIFTLFLICSIIYETFFLLSLSFSQRKISFRATKLIY